MKKGMKLEKYQNLVAEKCGVKLIRQPNEKTFELLEKLNTATKPLDIMVLCDKITDNLAGYDTEGFKIK